MGMDEITKSNIERLIMAYAAHAKKPKKHTVT